MIALRTLLSALVIFTGAAMALPAAAADREVSLKTPTGDLFGSFQAGASGRPAVLLLSGSGPTDRDGNQLPTLHTDAYKKLADGLNARGVATLRVDKRGVGASKGALSGEADLRITTYSDDARAWAAELKRLAGVQCVWIAGHSEGALLAELAAQNNPDICGIVMISGAGRTAIAVLKEQLATTPEPVKTELFKDLDDLAAGQKVDCSQALMSLCRPSIQPYMNSWLPLDPAALIKTVQGPVLILQGTNDLQISVADAERLAAARPDAKLIKLENVNHVLRVAPQDRQGNLATYARPDLPLAPGVVDAVADFVITGH